MFSSKKQRYETELVPITKGKRGKQIVAATIFCWFGLAIVIGALDEPPRTKAPALGYGVAVILLGLAFLYLAIRKQFETQLTAAGQAALAADTAVENRRQAKRDAAFLSWGFGLACLAAGIYLINPLVDMLQNRVTAYPIRCADAAHIEHCQKGRERVESVTIYSVHPDQQTVVGLTEGDPAPSKLFNCVIADRLNWSCDESPVKGSQRLVVRDGIFSYQPAEPWDIQYASRIG